MPDHPPTTCATSMLHTPPAVWLPAIRTRTGTDSFTMRLASALERRGTRVGITWLPPHAEYLPWTVKPPRPPSWAKVVHANSWLPARFLPAGLPVVVTLHSCVHDPVLDPYKSPLQRLYHRHWIFATEKRAIERADAVTAVSRYTADRASSVFDCRRITTIPNWTNLEDFKPDQRSKPNDPFRLLFAGSLNRRKGVDLLPTIMAKLGPRFELYYTGTEKEFAPYGSPTSNMKAIGRIENEKQLVEQYRACDALLFPTRLEGFGLVALEAMACGRPVITSDCSSLPEVLGTCGSGFLLPVDDIERFVEAATILVNDPTLWGKMGRQARRRAVRFTESSTVDSYRDLYSTLACD